MQLLFWSLMVADIMRLGTGQISYTTFCRWQRDGEMLRAVKRNKSRLLCSDESEGGSQLKTLPIHVLQ